MRPAELLALLALGAVWGGSFFFIRVAVPDFGPVPLMAARVGLAALLLGGLLAGRRRPLALRSHWRGLLVLGAANAAVPFVLIAVAELHITASLASILNAAQPSFAALIGWYGFGERLTVGQRWGLVLGAVSVAVLVGWSPLPGTFEVGLAVAAMMAAAALYAWAGIYATRSLSDVPRPTLVFGQQAAAAVWLAIPGVAGAPSTLPSAEATWALLGLVVLSTVVAYSLYFYLLERVGPTRTYTVTYIIPVFGVIWGWWLLDEPVTAGMLAGAVGIGVSLVLVNRIGVGRGARGRTGRPA